MCSCCPAEDNRFFVFVSQNRTMLIGLSFFLEMWHNIFVALLGNKQ